MPKAWYINCCLATNQTIGKKFFTWFSTKVTWFSTELTWFSMKDRYLSITIDIRGRRMDWTCPQNTSRNLMYHPCYSGIGNYNTFVCSFCKLYIHNVIILILLHNLSHVSDGLKEFLGLNLWFWTLFYSKKASPRQKTTNYIPYSWKIWRGFKFGCLVVYVPSWLPN